MKTLLLLILSMSALAQESNDVTHRPKNFSYKDGHAVFVDFIKADYDITFDANAQKIEVLAKISLDVIEEGYPIFDLVEDPTSVMIDGVNVEADVVPTPENETRVRIINKKMAQGRHTLIIKAPITTLIQFTKGSVKSAFWVTDLDDRMFLERYIPVNLEYDRVQMIFNLRFIGLRTEQHVFANGKVEWLSKKRARVTFPEKFTMNSVFFHTTPVGSVNIVNSSYKSIDGREIPVTTYQSLTDASEDLSELKDYAHRTLQELEQDYGAFPHASMLIYSADLSSMGLGGMEYAGATVTNYSALSHEIFHSYFARGVTPANGNAGWIDESLASWRDNGYNRRATLRGSSQMAAHPYYTRETDRRAYSFGAEFMAFLDGKFAAKGGLKPFMNKLLETKLFTPIFTEDFIVAMEEFYEEELSALFQTYVFDTGAKKSKECEHRRKATPAQLMQLL